MKNLKEYVKRPKGERLDCKQTSVNLDAKHYKFVISNGLNLSAMVRDMLDCIMDKAPINKR